MKVMRSLSALLCASLVFALMPLAARAATVETTYVDENGNTRTVTATVVESSTSTLTGGWYVVNGSITRNSTITVSGDAYVILADGASLTIYGDYNNAGINVSGSNRLTIYGQEQGTGRLSVTCGPNGAGIGGGYNQAGGTIAIRGGTVTATGNSGGAAIGGGENGNGGSITISGGTVSATGTSGGAAIGGGSGAAAGNIAISGGIVTAKARNGGAAIGGGNNGDAGSIAISGGTVVAEAYHDGAGIGSGAGGNAGSIAISGGSVDVVEGGTSSTPHNGANAPVYHTPITLFGIGDRTRVDALTTDAGYAYGTKDLYTEEGGSVIHIWLPAGTKTTAARITDGASTPTRKFYMGEVTTSSGSSSQGYLYLQAFIVTSKGTGYTYQNSVLTFTEPGAYTVSMAFTPTTDRMRVGVPSGYGTVAITLSSVNINASGTTDAAFDMTGASVSLTLLGANSLLGGKGKAGLLCPWGSGLTVTAESSGSLAAMGGTEEVSTGVRVGGAGIGGEFLIGGGNITINGGTIVATGGEDAAGIGCGDMLSLSMQSVANNSRVTINGGTVTANGGDYGAGIGSGGFGGGGTIIINNGAVTANGGIRAPGIGTGDYACINPNNMNDTNVTISGGTVQARGGAMAAGIGGGYMSTGGTIRISGGTVTATGGGGGQYGNGTPVSGGAGIGSGGGNNDSGFLSSTITISGGVVSATGGTEAAGIGGGWRNATNQDSVTISGGEVTARGGDYGAGIGGGISRPGGSINITAGTVRAYGGVAGAALGGGTSGNGGSVSISGGTVIATGGDAEGTSFGGAAGIGSGGTTLGTTQTRTSGDVTISGGTVTATGGAGIVGGAGIGGGFRGDAGNITIRGGTITANGGSYGAGIGGGAGGNGGSVAISGGSVKAVAGSGAEAIGKGNNGASSGSRTNGAGRNVYLNTLTLSGVSSVTAVTAGSIGGVPCAQTPDAASGVYGIKDVFTDAAGKVYFYLPIPAGSETVNLTAGTTTYGAAYQRIESGNTVTLEPLTDVTFAAEQTGGASGTADSTGITLTFSQPVTGLAGSDITIANGTGSATAGGLSGAGATWTLALTGVTAEGTITVSVRNFGSYHVTTAPQVVTVYKAVATTPSAPQSLSAAAGDGQVTLSWAAPASDGGAAITGYQVSQDDGASWVDAASDTGHTFTGLTNGQSYTFRVRAVNSVGAGAEAAVSATPQAPTATPPTPTATPTPSATPQAPTATPPTPTATPTPSATPTEVYRQTTLALGKTDRHNTWYAAWNYDYTITITNTGATVAHGVRLTDTLPAQIYPVGTLPPGAVVNPDGSVTWALSDMAAGEVRVLTLRVRTLSTVRGAVRNVVTATCPLCIGAVASDTTTIVAPPGPTSAPTSIPTASGTPTPAETQTATPTPTATPTERPVSGATATPTGAPGMASILARIWDDANGNARQDEGESPVVGATVELRAEEQGAVPLVTHFTDANGECAFRNLEPGRYAVVAGNLGRSAAARVWALANEEACVLFAWRPDGTLRAIHGVSLPVLLARPLE